MTSKPITVSLNTDQWELLIYGLRDYARIVQGRIDTGDFTHGLDQGNKIQWIFGYLSEKARQATAD